MKLKQKKFNFGVYIPVLLILLSLTIMVSSTFAYFTNALQSNGGSPIAFGKIELSDGSASGFSGSVMDAIPGSPLVDGAITVSLTSGSKPAYIRAKISYSGDEELSDYITALRQATGYNFASGTNDVWQWSTKNGNYVYLLDSNEDLLVVNDTTEYTLCSSFSLPTDVTNIVVGNNKNAQYMAQVQFHIEFQALQADNLGDENVEELFDELFPIPANEYYVYVPTLSASTITFASEAYTVALNGTKGITFTYNGDGVVSAVSGSDAVVTASVTDSTVTLTGVSTGSTTVTVSAAQGTNYSATSTTIDVTVVDKDVSINGVFHNTLQEAIAAAPDSIPTTIVLERDVVGYPTTEIQNTKNITFDTNNNTATFVAPIRVYGRLSVIGGGQVALASSTSANKHCIIVNNASIVNLSDVRVVVTSATGTRPAVVYMTGGILNMYDGADLECSLTSQAYGINVVTGTVNMYGGTINMTGTNSYGINSANANNVINIGTYDGEVSTTTPLIRAINYGVNCTNGVFNFYDGKISAVDSMNVINGVTAIEPGYSISSDIEQVDQTIYSYVILQ